jgi:DNA-binding transcriptional MerR regulator
VPETLVNGGRRVGELADATGLTIRTLHYYEETGLLVPSRTDAGHRIYDARDVARLHAICQLRRIGLPLDEIGRALDDASWSPPESLASQLRDVDAELDRAARRRVQLSRLVEHIANEDPSGTSDLIELVEEMTMLETTIQRRIATIVSADIEQLHAFLVRVFGFAPGEIEKDDAGFVHLGVVHGGDGEVWLHPESPEFKMVSPRTAGVSTATMAIMVDDVDAHFRHAQAEGAVIEYEPVDQPYGYREYSARDSEGGLWSFMKPLR